MRHNERGPRLMATTPRLSLVTNDEPDTTLDDSYPQHFLDCREGRHHWKRIGAFHAYGEITIARHCVNCGGDCWDHWSPKIGRASCRERVWSAEVGGAVKE